MGNPSVCGLSHAVFVSRIEQSRKDTLLNKLEKKEEDEKKL